MPAGTEALPDAVKRITESNKRIRSKGVSVTVFICMFSGIGGCPSGCALFSELFDLLNSVNSKTVLRVNVSWIVPTSEIEFYLPCIDIVVFKQSSGTRQL